MPLEFTRLLEALVLPPGGPLLLALLGLLLIRRLPRAGLALALTGWGVLALLALPPVAQHLADGLEHHPPFTPAAAAHARAIVVLGGGRYAQAPEYGGDTLSRHALERVRYAARVARETGLPVLVSSGAPFGGVPEADLMEEVLREFGVAPRWREPASRTTWENARDSAALLHPEGVRRIVLVTSAWHIPRAAAAFEAAGFEVVAGPTGYTRARPAAGGLTNWLPSADALDISRRMLRERLGALSYALRRSPASAGAPSDNTGSPGG